ncbi:DNA-binding response regulator, OmpR family, contains REC and winged-helix (wHTH) domain [Chitinophaga terrae (ex Kim and Jung 2007)]|uniref:DNA-binding response regulator, OmpR family, contains REC and winged-helix (WHTH) domain n=1 Tax=Chitinophaga terrae (ex Kim and Jung 2007) TaxID=408074 RepID=A0A1H4FSI4_9BACT|nr:response regulator transcription factor [Chitinophaga terrae (ex Kim and Jung 2007)]MDQ0105406.1 DNA-binding response OmpR family regulator [Chitinophaga terrae (ex Kim and Jung 2007)]GEP92830.1 DNA-binding response regulator [Chitinophaga terrae (ex Kim and Jung 2007)]SEB00244.1 DNA-binding response regulator, OmpR family, contains REC and winged-helix (wHTH) domain [Chitinophaga terrae (ex Kim and Jung 2007)]
MAKVLLIEDEVQLGQIVKDSLEMRGFEMLYAADGREGLKLFQQERPDVVVLDIMMPNMDGFTVTSEIRKQDKITPIIFLTAKSQTTDVVKGFELGGNDYLKKPFSMDELIVRITALLKRFKDAPASAAEPEEGAVSIGQYSFNYTKQTLTRNNVVEFLSHREAAILKRLYDNKNDIMERKAILIDLWGDDNFFNARSMDVFITKLRRYLKDDSRVQIVNIRGVGYKLIF